MHECSKFINFSIISLYFFQLIKCPTILEMNDTKKTLLSQHEIRVANHSKLFLDIYVPSKFTDTGNKIIDLSEVTNTIESSNSSSVVILGNSGYGKTSLGLHLCTQYWKAFERRESDRIPIYFYLPDYASDNCQNLLEKVFIGDDQHEITFSDQQRKYLLILDSYEQLGNEKFNVHDQQHGIWRWSSQNGFIDVKTVLFCRPQHIPDKTERLKLFKFDKNKSQQHSEFNILPFNMEQIDNYIEHFVNILKGESQNALIQMVQRVNIENQESPWCKKETYRKWMDIYPDLYKLAETPMLLTIILTILPALVQELHRKGASATEKQKIELICSTKTGIYDQFSKQWFEYQATRIRDGKLLPDLCRLEKTDLVNLLQMYSQNLAIHLMRSGNLVRNSIIAADAENWLLGDPASMPELLQICHRVLLVGELNIPDSESELLFGLSDTSDASLTEEDKVQRLDNLKALRDGCLLQYDASTRRYRFCHFSLAIYFASKELFETMEKVFQLYVSNRLTKDKSQLISASILLDIYLNHDDHPEVIQELANRVRLSEEFASVLLQIVEKSKELPGLVKLSSNSATILCAGGFNLSGRDWQDVQLKCAKLDYGLMGNTDLRGADLSGASMQQIWMPGAKLNGTNLEDVEFGEVAALKPPDQQDKTNLVRSVSLYKDGFWLVPFVCGNIYQFDIQTWQSSLVLQDNSNTFRKLINCALYNVNDKVTYLITYVSKQDGGREVKVWSFDGIMEEKSTFDIMHHFSTKRIDYVNPKDWIRDRIVLDKNVKILRTSDYFGFQVLNCLVILRLVTISNMPEFQFVQGIEHPVAEYAIEMYEIDGEAYICYADEQQLHISKYDQAIKQFAPHNNVSFVNGLVSVIYFCHNNLVIGADMGKLVVMRPTAPYDLFHLRGHNLLITAVTSNVNYVASACVNCIYVWSIADEPWTLVRSINNSVEITCTSLAMSLNAKWLALGSTYTNNVPIVPIATSANNPLTKRNPNLVFDLVGDGQRNFLAATKILGTKTFSISSHNLTTGNKQCSLTCDNAYLLNMVFVEGGKSALILTRERDRKTDEILTLSLYSGDELKLKKKLELHVQGIGAEIMVDANAFIDDNHPMDCRIAYGFEGQASCVIIWDLKVHLTEPYLTIENRLDFDLGAIGAQKLSDILMFRLCLHSEWFAATLTDKMVCLWNTSNSNIHSVRKLSTNELNTLKFTTDGTQLIGCGELPEIMVWTVNSSSNEYQTVRFALSEEDTTANFVTCIDSGIFITFVSMKLVGFSLKGPDNSSFVSLFELPLWFVAERCIQYIDPEPSSIRLVISGNQLDEQCCIRIKRCEERGKNDDDITEFYDNRWSWTMLWVKSPCKSLHLDKADVTRAFNVQPSNNALLRQHGGIGHPAQKHEGNYRSLASLFVEIPGTTLSPRTFGDTVIKVDNEVTRINNDQWAIFAVATRTPSLLAKLSNMLSVYPHVFFVVEGFCNNRRFVIKAELVKYQNEQRKWIGRVRILSWSDFENFKNDASNFQAKRFEVTSDNGRSFLKKIHREVQRNYEYSLLSTGLSDSVTCVTWAEKMLTLAKISRTSDRWYNLWVVLPADVVYT